MRADSKSALIITGASVAYATVRYNVFKGVPWSDWPIYIVNKALALSSLLLLLAWLVRHRRSGDGTRSSLPAIAVRLVLIHAALSLAILSPAYFPALFADGKLTWQTGVSLLIGVLAATGLVTRVKTQPPSSTLALGLGVVALMAGCHAMIYGYGSWLSPSTWPGYLVPITLISFVSGLTAMAVALRPVSTAGR